jgi:hypothetical protein
MTAVEKTATEPSGNRGGRVKSDVNKSPLEFESISFFIDMACLPGSGVISPLKLSPFFAPGEERGAKVHLLQYNATSERL